MTVFDYSKSEERIPRNRALITVELRCSRRSLTMLLVGFNVIKIT